MKDASVGLERLFRREIAWNCGVGVQQHCDSDRGWAEESGQICGSVKNTYALAPEYQGNYLYIVVNRLFYKSEKIPYFLQFKKT